MVEVRAAHLVPCAALPARGEPRRTAWWLRGRQGSSQCSTTMRHRDTGPARRWLSECPSLPRPRCCRAARQTRRSCARLLPRPRPFCHPLLAMLHCDLEDNAFPRALLVLSARRGRVYSRLLVSRLRPERWSARVSRILKARVALAGGRKRTSRQGTRHLPTVPSTFSRSRT